MKRFTKAISMLLVIVMVVSLLPLSVIAEDIHNTHTVQFKLNYNGAHKIPSQKVADGECAVQPEDVTRTGWIFEYWYVKTSDGIQKFDLSQPITEDVTLYARWDEDISFWGPIWSRNILNGIENSMEDDTTETPDDEETDDDTDVDGYDGIDDSDIDGLSDYDEVDLYNTDPDNLDTDGDGVSDGREVLVLFTNPLVPDSVFNVTLTSMYEGSISASVEISDLSGKEAETLRINPVFNEVYFPESMPGYIGPAFNFKIDGDFDKAEICFEFSAELVDDDFDPIIYYFNEDDMCLEPLPTTITGNTAKTTVTHFSKYILLNRSEFEKSFVDEWQEVPKTTETFESLQIVFVVDDSGSMGNNDTYNKRLDVARELIERLPTNSSIGIVRFATKTEVLTEVLMSDKNSAKDYLSTSYFKSSGNTYLYEAVLEALTLYQETDSNVLKMMVVLSDGIPSRYTKQNAAISTAQEQNVKIFTVGLGSGLQTSFDKYLKPLSEHTDGNFYLASVADELADIYSLIGDSIDIFTDSDSDGIPDYYEDSIIAFNGVKYTLDKNNPDTDGDGIADGEEVKLTYTYTEDKNQVLVTAWLNSDPLIPNSSQNSFDPIWPTTETYNVTTLYYYNTYGKNPATGARKPHSCAGNNYIGGMDLDLSEGHNIMAIADGEVVLSGYNPNNPKGYKPNGYGNYVIIRHSKLDDDGTEYYYSLYAHLSSVSVSKGQTITQSMIIGKSGNTGASTGAHLHFEIFEADYAWSTDNTKIGDIWKYYSDLDLVYDKSVYMANKGEYDRAKDSHSKKFIDYIDEYYTLDTTISSDPEYKRKKTHSPEYIVVAPEFDKSIIGDIAKEFETSSEDPGFISSGAGDAGGKSYGIYQLASNIGIPKIFTDWLLKQTTEEIWTNIGTNLSNAYSKDGNTYGINFDDAWKAAALEYRHEFEMAQIQFCYEKYYLSCLNSIIATKSYTYSVSGLSEYNTMNNIYPLSIHQMIWARAVQGSPGAKYIAEAYSRAMSDAIKSGKENDIQYVSEKWIYYVYWEASKTDREDPRVRKSDSTAKIIEVNDIKTKDNDKKEFYTEKLVGTYLVYFSSSSGNVQYGVYNRLNPFIYSLNYNTSGNEYTLVMKNLSNDFSQ